MIAVQTEMATGKRDGWTWGVEGGGGAGGGAEGVEGGTERAGRRSWPLRSLVCCLLLPSRRLQSPVLNVLLAPSTASYPHC
jgi:hypothetical protein